MAFICHSYVLVCHSYVIRMSSVCHSYVVLCHPYVTRMYSYVTRMPLVCTTMSLVCTRMSAVCHSSVILPWIFGKCKSCSWRFLHKYNWRFIYKYIHDLVDLVKNIKFQAEHSQLKEILKKWFDNIFYRMDINVESNDFITIKDHKENLLNHPELCLINAAKNELRGISKT